MKKVFPHIPHHAYALVVGAVDGKDWVDVVFVSTKRSDVVETMRTYKSYEGNKHKRFLIVAYDRR